MHFLRTHWIRLFLMLDLFLLAVIAGLYASGQPVVSGVLNKISGTVSGAVRLAQSDLTHASAAQQEKSVHLDVPLILQKPELPRGCEVTSLAMMLAQAGVRVDKMELAANLKKLPYRSDDRYGDPDDGFVGNMYHLNQPGFGVYHRPLADLAGQYLPFRIDDLSGKSFDAVLASLDKGRSVVVWTNVTFRPLPDSAFETWRTGNGKIRVTRSEHAVLVTGYDGGHIYFNNPLGGKNERADRTAFIRAWEQMGSQAVTYRTIPFIN
ncbi:C39 family peptidase [Sporolactobacillus vineae]|uniref:C39 family peptidase n=1 Tax=Sporolactobacillus vineae TaxID=444463 RepID=UPI000289F639|nr:C39 family peptidase [Sporolactobacillus vineae]